MPETGGVASPGPAARGAVRNRADIIHQRLARHAPGRQSAMRHLLMLLCAILTLSWSMPADAGTPKFKRIPTQFIAALAEPGARSGTGAESWGVWRVDPGPRGVWLKHFELLKTTGGITPASWRFDPDDWWLDENGLIMEHPEYPLPAGRYLVTGRREVTSILTVHPADAQGHQAWELSPGTTIHDVTHLKCRSARYRPEAGGVCSPEGADRSVFPIVPGAVMPAVPGCSKQDYTVLFIIGVEWTPD